MNLASLFSDIAAAAKLLPVAISLATTIQAAIPDSPGSVKLTAVKTALTTAISTEQAVQTEFEAVWPIVSSLLSGVITAFKVHSVAGFTPSVPPAA